MTKLMVEIPEHQYNNIMSLDSINLARAPYKGIIMYAVNAIKRATIIDENKEAADDRAENQNT